MGDIEKGLVDGNRFYEVGIILEDVVNLLRHLFIMFVSARHDDEVGAEAFCLCDRLCRMYAEATCLIAGCRHHTPWTVEAYRNGFAPKFRIVSLLYCRKEGVHINVNDFSILHFMQKYK